MTGVNDALARRATFIVYILSLLISSLAFDMPSMTHVKVPHTTTQCSVCTTATPDVAALNAAVLRHRAASAASAKVPVPSPTPQSPSPTRQVPVPSPSPVPSPTPQATTPMPQAPQWPGPQGPQQNIRSGGVLHETTTVPFINQVFPGLKNPKHLNIPAIAGMATGGAVIVGGGIAAAVMASKKHNAVMQQAESSPKAFLGKSPVPVQSMAQAPQHFVSTRLAAPVRKGDTTIEVASIVGLAIGDTIKIGTEYNMIKGFSSIILDHPMNNDIADGADVTVVHEPVNAQVMNASTTTMMPPIPLGKVLGGTRPPISAKAVGPAPAPPAATEKDDDMKTLYYILLGGLSVCCFFFCIVAVCAIIMRRASKNDDEDAYSGISEESEEELSEDYEPDPARDGKRELRAMQGE